MQFNTFIHLEIEFPYMYELVLALITEKLYYYAWTPHTYRSRLRRASCVNDLQARFQRRNPNSHALMPLC